MPHTYAAALRADHAAGMGYDRLAKKYGINRTHARAITLGREANQGGLLPRKPYATFAKDVERAQGGLNYPTPTLEEYERLVAEWEGRV